MIFRVGPGIASPPKHSARAWRMRAEEMRTLVGEMTEAEPKSIMLRTQLQQKEKDSGGSPLLPESQWFCRCIDRESLRVDGACFNN